MKLEPSFKLVQLFRGIAWLAGLGIETLAEDLDSLKYLKQKNRESLEKFDRLIDSMVDEVERKENCSFDVLLIRELKVWAAECRPGDEALRERLEKYEREEDF